MVVNFCTHIFYLIQVLKHYVPWILVGTSSGLLDSMFVCAAAVAELHNASEGTKCNGPWMLVGTKGFVNISDSPKTKTHL